LTHLLLADPGDPVASWAREGIAARGLALDEVSSLQLCTARRWVHRVSSVEASVEVHLDDGRLLRGGDVRSVFNRLAAVPEEWLLAVAAADREYAYVELTALVCSAFHALPCPVVNRPVPGSLSGPWRGAVEWAVLAGRAGLAVPQLRLSSDEEAATASETAAAEPWHVFVVEGRVVARTPPPAAIAAACARLASAAGVALLGVELNPVDAPAGAVFRRASTLPDLRLGGDPLLDVLADTLGR
jgi:hypothetical protein